MQVSSARAVGHFAVKAGTDEFRRRGLVPRPDRSRRRPGSRRHDPVRDGPYRTPPPGGAGGSAPSAATPLRRPATRPGVGTDTAAGRGNGTRARGGRPLSIPGFDTLSASQVVQRLDGLNRSELVSVRAYEASTRGRRTILSRVDQLLDERS